MLEDLVPPLIASPRLSLLWCRRLYVGASGADGAPTSRAAMGIVLRDRAARARHGAHADVSERSDPPWVSEVHSDQNSQQLSDGHTLSHVIHGALFYGVTHLAMGPASLGSARGGRGDRGDVGVYENTDTVINRYRARRSRSATTATAC